MKLEELILGEGGRDHFAPPEVDALREEDALVDAALISIRVEPTWGLAALLFDCRAALQAREGNVALVIVNEVALVRQVSRALPRAWARVESWSPRFSSDGFQIDALVAPAGELSITGRVASYVVGNAPALPDAPPDLTASSVEEVRSGFPNWSSDVEITARASIGW